MADNKYKGEVEIELGDKTYKMVFDWDAIAKLQSTFPKEVLATTVNDPQAKVIAEMIAIGLQKNHPEEANVEFVLKAPPPLFKASLLVDKAIALGYFGPEMDERMADSKDGDLKKSQKTK